MGWISIAQISPTPSSATRRLAIRRLLDVHGAPSCALAPTADVSAQAVAAAPSTATMGSTRGSSRSRPIITSVADAPNVA